MGLSKTRGLLLFSGGLDSQIAAKILMEQNIELTGLHFLLPFFSPLQDPYKSEPARLADSIGLKLRIENPFNHYIKMLKNPKHGYGKNINPCIDCKILFLSLAAEILKKENYDFIATGEVNGQRPMSQRRDMIRHIEKSANLDKYILRPLSAKFFPKTIVEEKGLIDSSKLLDIHGRGRNRQIELAEKYGITGYQSPAGGCLFTEVKYAIKLRDLFDHESEYSQEKLYLLSIGRHFRISENTRIIISRNEAESEILAKFKNSSSYYSDTDFSAPSLLCYTTDENPDFDIMASIISKYGRPTSEKHTITFFKDGFLKAEYKDTLPAAPETIQKYRIG